MTEIEQICKAVKRRIRDTKATSLQLLTCSQMGDSPHFAVEPSLVVCDSKTAFYGVFKHYHSAGDYFREIKMDLRKLAEQYERRRLQGRPPSLVLFAVIPVGADTLDHNGFSSGLRMVQDRERLLEAVGLSRLFWGPNTAEAVKCWGEGSLKVDVEVERFLAPLLLRVRKIAAKGDRSEWLDRWQSKTKQAVHDVLQDDRAGSDSGPRADLQQEAWTHLSSQLGSLNSPQREPEQPWLLKSITGLRQFRRFNHKDVPDEVPFGSDLTILYGANGSGKSSLIDAVMLGLAGEVRAAGGKSVVSLEELAHKGDIPPDGKFGELVTAFPPVAVENKKVAQEKERFDIRVRPEDAVPPVDTFCMSQSSLRFFMDMDPARRFDWISERLGLDRSLDRRIDVLLQGLHREIAPHASRFGFVFSHHQLGKMMESFENAVCAHVQSICTAPEFSRAVKAVEDALQAVRTAVLAAGQEETPLKRFSDQLSELQNRLDRYHEMAEDFTVAFKAGQKLSPKVNQISTRATELVDSVSRLESLLPPHDLQQVELAKQNLEANRNEPYSGPDQKELQAELRRLEAQIKQLRDLRRGLEKAEQLLSAARGLSTELMIVSEPGLACLRTLEGGAPRLDRDISERIGRFRMRVGILSQNDASFGAVIAGLRAVQRPLNDRVTRLHREMHEALVMDAGQKNLLRDELHAAIKKLFLSLGVRMPWEKSEPSAALFGYSLVDAVLSLAAAVRTLVSTPVPALDAGLQGMLRHYFDSPPLDKPGEKPGAYVSLYEWIILRKKQEDLRTRIQQLVADDFINEFGTTQREILWALTGFSWGQLPVDLVINQYTVAMQTKLGGVENIYNLAEQNILGLSIFFTAYLYVGSRWSQAILIDDPFQNLDDVNLLGFVRMFDDVAHACNARQVVIALHQKGLAEYIKGQFAGDPVCIESGETPGFVMLEVAQSSDMESTVKALPFKYREDGALECCADRICRSKPAQ